MFISVVVISSGILLSLRWFHVCDIEVWVALMPAIVYATTWALSPLTSAAPHTEEPNEND